MRVLTRTSKRSSRPIWFMATVVTVSLLGWMHRFQQADPQLILALQQQQDSSIDVEEDFKPAAQRRSMMREETPESRQHAQLKLATNQALAEADQAQAKLETLQKQVAEAAKALEQAQAAKAKIEAETAQIVEAATNKVQKAEESSRPEEDETEALASKEEEEESKPVVDKEEVVEDDKKEESSKPAEDKEDPAQEAVDSKKEVNDDNKKVATKESSQAAEDDTTTKAVAQQVQVATTTNVTDRQVYFMGFPQVEEKDAFSASWLQTTEDFMDMELWRIGICEDAAFWAFRRHRRKKLRMSLDWMDFSLEHLSKWWKMLQIYGERQIAIYNTAMTRFDNYLANAATFPLEKEQSFRETIAVIAYQPYRDGNVEKAFNLTMKSLGATMESLRRAGFGRVVVVGSDSNVDLPLTQSTFRLLQSQLEPNLDPTINVTKVGHMEVGYAQFNPEHAVTKTQKKNVPKAALEGLRQAFVLRDQKKQNPEEEAYVKLWLGEKLDWKYVYLTEPDSILQFRTSTLKQLKQQVDHGMVLVPHRLQPIPHESDARGSAKDFLYLDEADFPVVDLDSNTDSCCDYHKGPRYKPGKTVVESCGNFWYMCDFTRRKPKAERTHKRIKEYSLIRLKQGTEIVSLAALEHGRPCQPKKNDVCLPPDLDKQTK